MGIALSAIAAAFCVWLAVRIVNRRERWAKWTLAMTLGAPVLYALSFGPACWFWAAMEGNCEMLGDFYGPLVEVAAVTPKPLQTLFCKYATLAMPTGRGIFFVCGEERDRFTILSKSDFRLLSVGRVKSHATRVNSPAPTPDATSESN